MARAIVLALALTWSAASAQDTDLPGYEWRAIGDGVHLHTRADPLAGPVDGNSVVILTADDVFVVDTHIDPAAARAVVARIRALTDRPVTHVVNTHWHDDHTNGNYVYQDAFPGVRFLSHPATLAALEEGWEAMEDERRETYGSLRGQDLLAAAEAVAAQDPQRAIGIRVFAGYRDALEPELPDLRLVFPDEMVDGTRAFERPSRRIVVESVGAGNTEGDLVVWLPDDSILITGDILVSPVPFAFDAPMTDWVETLGRLDGYEAETIVPGHGAPMTDASYIADVRSLLEATLDAVRDARAEGVAYGDLRDAVDLSAFEERFTAGAEEGVYAWRSYFLAPGLQSAWKALGYPVPEDDGND